MFVVDFLEKKKKELERGRSAVGRREKDDVRALVFVLLNGDGIRVLGFLFPFLEWH